MNKSRDRPDFRGASRSFESPCPFPRRTPPTTMQRPLLGSEMQPGAEGPGPSPVPMPSAGARLDPSPPGFIRARLHSWRSPCGRCCAFSGRVLLPHLHRPHRSNTSKIHSRSSSPAGHSQRGVFWLGAGARDPRGKIETASRVSRGWFGLVLTGQQPAAHVHDPRSL